MRAEDLYAFTRRQPFVPFRIHSTDARTYDVWHPDQVIPMRSRVIVGVGVGVGGEGAPPDAVEHLSLIHMIRLEEIDAERRQNAGQN